MTAFITIGLPASGKTSWAKEYVAQHPNTVRINNDDIRNEYYNNAGHRNWSPAVEDHVRKEREARINAAAKMGVDCVIDNTHMNAKTLKQTMDLCKSLGYEVETVDFRHVSVEECVRRDSLRTGHEQVGEAVIRRMYKKHGQVRAERNLPRYQFEEGKPVAVIVDIDGTLAEMTTRGPFDEHRVYEDLPRNHVVITVDALRQAVRARVLVMSGRSEQCRAETARWLEEVCLMPKDSYELFMRAADDRRRDSIVKRELYEQHVAGRYSILAVFDDRRSVIEECWDKLDLPVFRCGRINCDNF